MLEKATLGALDELLVDVLLLEPLLLLLLLLPQAAMTTARQQAAANVSNERFTVILSSSLPHPPAAGL
jgi:hypothetical protein